MSIGNNSKEMCEARKVSPDWQGISVLMTLTTFGANSLRGENDGALINAMSPECRTQAAEIIYSFQELHQQVKELRDEIEYEIRESVEFRAQPADAREVRHECS